MRKKLLLLSIVIVMALLSLSGCMFLKDNEMDALLSEALNAVQAEDYDKLASMLSKGAREELNGSVVPFEDMHKIFHGTVRNYTAIERNIRSDTHRGELRILTKSSRYIVTTDEGTFEVLLSMVSSAENSGITQFQITPRSASFMSSIFPQFNSAGSWLMLVFSLLVLIFRIVTTVSAVKSNIKMKPLWIALIWIAQSGFCITSTPNRFHFSIQLINAFFSGFQSLAGGGFSLTVLLPVGAILYWILRKKLTDTEPPNPNRYGKNNPPYYGSEPFQK